MRSFSQSASEYFLLEKKAPHCKSKTLTPPKLGAKITVLVIAFRIALTLKVNILWFGCQGTVCVKKRNINAIFGCSWFQQFNLDCWQHKLLIGSPKTEYIFSFVFVLYGRSHLSWFHKLIYNSSSFCPWVTNPDVKSNKKKIIFRSVLIYTIVFIMLKIFEENPKY